MQVRFHINNGADENFRGSLMHALPKKTLRKENVFLKLMPF